MYGDKGLGWHIAFGARNCNCKLQLHHALLMLILLINHLEYA